MVLDGKTPSVYHNALNQDKEAAVKYVLFKVFIKVDVSIVSLAGWTGQGS